MKRCPHVGCKGRMKRKSTRAAFRCGFPLTETILQCTAEPEHRRRVWTFDMGETSRQRAGDGDELERRAKTARRARVEAVEHADGLLLRTVE